MDDGSSLSLFRCSHRCFYSTVGSWHILASLTCSESVIVI